MFVAGHPGQVLTFLEFPLDIFIHESFMNGPSDTVDASAPHKVLELQWFSLIRSVLCLFCFLINGIVLFTPLSTIFFLISRWYLRIQCCLEVLVVFPLFLKHFQLATATGFLYWYNRPVFPTAVRSDTLVNLEIMVLCFFCITCVLVS